MPALIVKNRNKCKRLGAGESANGAFPVETVSTMAAIVSNAEPGVDYYSQYSFIR